MVPLLVVVFIVVPIAELAVIVQVGREIGVGSTIGLLIVASVAGSLLMRSQGRASWKRFQVAVQAGRPPAREVLDGALVLLGGAFLLTPGFITDALGLALLLPPTRALVRRALARRLLQRTVAAVTRAQPARRPHSADVEGTAVEVDPPPPPRR